MKNEHLLNEIIIPTLDYLEMDSPIARDLLLGTAAQESHMGRYLVQLGGVENGGLGIYQMEQATHDDIWENYLAYRPVLTEKIEALLIPGIPKEDQLKGNLYYATALARLHYRRVPKPFPKVSNAKLLGHYWKNHYNTHLGDGTVEQFEKNFRRFVRK